MAFVLIFGIGVIILGIVYLVSTFVGRRRQESVADWPTTSGVIRNAYVYRHEKRTSSKTTITYTPVVEYTYLVDGEGYFSNKHDLSAYVDASFEEREKAEAIVAKYPLESSVAVHYNPALPQQAVLEVYKPAGYNLELVSGLFNLLVGGGMVALYFVLR